MDMMDNAKRVAHMPTATIIEAGIRFKIGLKSPTRVHDEEILIRKVGVQEVQNNFRLKLKYGSQEAP
jgi:hypothetical protein